MNFKTTYFLFGLLALMFLALAVSLFLTPPEATRAGYLFPSMHVEGTKLETDAIDRITIERKSPSASTIVAEKDGKNWRIVQPKTMAADKASLESLLFNLRGAKFDAEAKTPSWSSAGLNAPSRIITLEGSKRKFVLTIGEVTEGEDRGYAYAESSERKGQVLTIRKTDIRTALEELPHFRGKELLGDTTDINRLKLALGKKTPLELKRDKGIWSFVSPTAFGEAEPTDVLTILAGLNITHVDEKNSDFVKDGETDLAKYNLDPAQADVLRIEVWHDQSQAAAVVGTSKKEGEKYFAAIDDPTSKTRDIVKVAAGNVDKIVKWLDDPSSLRNKNLVKLQGNPDAVDVTNTFGLLEFRHADPVGDWKLYRGSSPGKVDPLEVRKLIDGLNRKDQVTGFPDPSKRKELGIDRPDAVVVKVWADSLEKPEAGKTERPVFKKDAKPVAELRFGLIQGDSVAVERKWGDVTSLVLVPKELLATVQQRPLDYYDRNVPPFNSGSAEENVIRVEIVRPGESYEVAREKATGPWKIVKPDALKGRTANEEVLRSLLSDLNRIMAKEIVAEKADPMDLAKDYDLEKPPLRVVITQTKDGKEVKQSFDFGKEKPGKGVYAKLGDNPAIYVVDSAVTAATKKDLRDPTVLAFEMDAVSSVTFSGWQKVVGSVLTRKIDRKGTTWETSDKDIKLDTDKVENLIRSLTRLQAEKFVPAGKGLAYTEGSFQVQITLNDKRVLTLKVGAEEGSAAYAESSELKGETVMIRADLFSGPRSAPAYFTK
ncbi:MAG: DUF4340 domain-containing protein [Planctomycetia bacterium]|nr:DUF4340 domain-containing protein [Planctomycetia bacterium]